MEGWDPQSQLEEARQLQFTPPFMASATVNSERRRKTVRGGGKHAVALIFTRLLSAARTPCTEYRKASDRLRLRSAGSSC